MKAPFGRRIGRALARHIPAGTPLPILRGPLHGSRWAAGAHAGAGKGLSVLVNQYETVQLETAWNLLAPGSVCLDVGANAGLYSLLFAKQARLVYAFEPVPENIRRLCSTMRLNRVDNVIVVPCAAGARPALVGLAEGVSNAASAVADHGLQPAASITLDDFCARFAVTPHLIKLDVEGAEFDVLRGAKAILTAAKPAILLSVHSDDLRRASLTFLHAVGYHAYAAFPRSAGATHDTEFVVTADPAHPAHLKLPWSALAGAAGASSAPVAHGEPSR